MRSTSAWVITDGVNAGVMKYVGEVLKEGQANEDENHGVCIGITPWEIVTDRNRLIGFGCTVEYDMSSSEQNRLIGFGRTVEYDMSSSVNKEGTFLDNNHTHFLLVDQDPKNHCNAEIDFRAVFQRAIRNTKFDGTMIRDLRQVLLLIINEFEPINQLQFHLNENHGFSNNFRGNRT